MYLFVDGDDDKQRDLSWLTCLMLLVVCALVAGG